LHWPPPDEPPVKRWIRVARLDDLHPAQPRIVRVGVKQLALFLHEGRVYATSNVCPHAGGSLGHGRVVGRQVICPRHFWSFDLETGECPHHDIYQLTTYPVDVRGADVFVLIEATVE
jgi:nitrite reductase/ring-hydroxylating ferredoxin subunit